MIKGRSLLLLLFMTLFLLACEGSFCTFKDSPTVPQQVVQEPPQPPGPLEIFVLQHFDFLMIFVGAAITVFVWYISRRNYKLNGRVLASASLTALTTLLWFIGVGPLLPVWILFMIGYIAILIWWMFVS